MPHNPYAPPTAPVDGVEEKTAFDFSESADYSFTPKQLWWAGVGCLLSVALTPLYFFFIFTAPSVPVLKDFSVATAFVMTGLTIYIYLIFKKLLNEKSGYRGANLAISLYILMSILSALAAPFSNDTDTSLTTTLIAVGEIVLVGIIAIYLGIQLLRCEDPLFEQKKAIAYLTIAIGITLVSVVLAMLGVLISLVLGVVMAILFFRASKALAKAQS
jgi:hypothetical protein